MAHLQDELPQNDKSKLSELSVEDVECIQIRKAFCAAQTGLSDFIRLFAKENEIPRWFDMLRASVSRRERSRMAAAEENIETWVGDMCVYINYTFNVLITFCGV
jgi:hypothetical protein